MQTKLAKLLRYHRQNVFHDNQFIADSHYRALVRLKRSKTFAAMAARNRDHAEYIASERLLRAFV